jgi:hypothetical protein
LSDADEELGSPVAVDRAAAPRRRARGEAGRATGRALPSVTTAPLGRQGSRPPAPEPLRVRERRGSLDSLLNLVRMVLVVLFGLVVGAFISAALGF